MNSNKAPLQYDLARFITSTEQSILAAGIQLTISNDFEELAESVKENELPIALPKMFAPERVNQLPAHNFWIKGTDKAGRIVHTQAFNYASLRGKPLIEYLNNVKDLYCPVLPVADKNSIQFQTSDALNKVSGTVCYQSAIWIKEDLIDQKDPKIVALLSVLGFTLAVTTWAPDYIFSLISQNHVFKGLPTRLGYRHMHPYALNWKISNSNIDMNDWLVWLSQDEFVEIAGVG